MSLGSGCAAAVDPVAAVSHDDLAGQHVLGMGGVEQLQGDLAFGGRGVAWKMEQTYNARRRISVTNVERWARENLK